MVKIWRAISPFLSDWVTIMVLNHYIDMFLAMALVLKMKCESWDFPTKQLFDTIIYLLFSHCYHLDPYLKCIW